MTRPAEDGPSIREIGEFALIDRLLAQLPATVRSTDALVLSAGDDAAVGAVSPGERIVVSVDTLVDRVHFRLDWADWASLGHKSLAVNLSDLAAMGARPLLAVISLGLTGDEQVDRLEAFYHYLGTLAERYGTAVAGGDIVASPGGLSITVTVIGETVGGQWLARSGAQVGDRIVVSGSLGASAAGLELLRLDAGDARRQAATAPMLIEAHLRPEPRVELGRVLLEGGATAAMDLSDGLLGDLPKLLTASGVSGRIDLSNVPVPAAVRALFPDRWRELALRGGEDYELLATIPPDRLPALIEAAHGIDSTVTEIGEVITGRLDGQLVTMLDESGVERPVDAGAFDHFRAGR